MLRDLSGGQLGHGSRGPCAAVNTHQRVNDEILPSVTISGAPDRGLSSPAGSFVDGGIGSRVKVDDPGPAPLPPLLLVVVALDGSEERRAGGREGGLVPQRRRGPLAWAGSRGAHYTHPACQSNPESY